MAVDGRDEGTAGGARVPEQGSTGEDGADGAAGRAGPVRRGAAGRPARHAADRDGRPARDQVPQQRGRPLGAEPSPSDAELVARVRGGEDGAYEELYRRHAAAVRRYARTCCRDPHTAEDLTGEVFAGTLQAIRGGSGPESAVRAYLLTTVRRVAASWGRTARREHLVEDFAVFAASAAAGPAQVTEAGADVRAMREADRSLAVRAFRTLPERWQAVLWHTAVEEESPSQVAPLLGLTANATAVLAHRAREGLRQAYLQAHVSAALTEGGACARYADRLGAHARGGLRLRADRELRRHLADCERCRAAAADLADVNACLKSLLPVSVLGWFATGYAVKAAGAAAGAAAAAAAGAAGSSSGTAGGAGSEALGAPAKVGIAVSVVVAGAGVALAATLLSGGGRPAGPAARPPASPTPVASVPARPPASPAPRPAPTAARPAPARPPAHRAAAPEPSPTRRARPTRPAPPSPPAPPAPTPSRSASRVYQVDALPVGPAPDGQPFVLPSPLDWFWQRHGLTAGGRTYAEGISVPVPSTLTVDLGGRCAAYDAMAGLDRYALGRERVRFLVYGDGTLLYASPVVARDSVPVPVRVPLAGRGTLRLAVRRVDGGALLGLADWADSRLRCR